MTRLTAAQALVRALAAQRTDLNGQRVPLFAGGWAIFGHGNVAGMGEALHGVRDTLPTFRAHNEQAMAHAAIAFAKASRRRRVMACTTSIGPGALNLVTAAAVAHINRLPVLLLPGDVFASRRPDPVLQQIESFADGTVTANDAFRPVSRYFDRLTRPEQLIPAFDRAMTVLTDPAECGPVTLAFCQDVQAQAADYPPSFFAERVWIPRRPRPDADELTQAAQLLRQSSRPLVIAGGGVLYSEAEIDLLRWCETHGVPGAVTQAGKSALPSGHPLNLGAIGVTGTEAANALAREADLIVAVGTRLQDFTTGSWSLFAPGRHMVALNTQPLDAYKHRAQPLLADARAGLADLSQAVADWRAPQTWADRASQQCRDWSDTVARVTAPPNAGLPSDAQVLGAVQHQSRPTDVVVCAAGGLPGELHKLWQAGAPGGYHVEYGFSCMGYEIAGGLGVKMADPSREVFVLLGDGSYLMLNSEIATSIMLGLKLTIVVLDNRGFGCINRLQHATGGESFNNLLAPNSPFIDFAGHAASLGASAEKVGNLAELDAALTRARAATRTTVVVIDTDPTITTEEGGAWWDVAVPEISARKEVRAAHEDYLSKRELQQVGQ